MPRGQKRHGGKKKTGRGGSGDATAASTGTGTFIVGYINNILKNRVQCSTQGKCSRNIIFQIDDPEKLITSVYE